MTMRNLEDGTPCEFFSPVTTPIADLCERLRSQNSDNALLVAEKAASALEALSVRVEELEAKVRDHFKALLSVVAAAGGEVSVEPGDMHDLPKMRLERYDDLSKCAYVYRAFVDKGE